MKCAEGKTFNEFCKIIGKPDIGSGTWIGFFTVIDGSGGLTIGRNCDISSGVHIYTHDSVKRCVTNTKFSPDGTVNREAISKSPVQIGDNVFIGANAIVMKGTRIGNRSIIGAGSVVLSGTVIGPEETWAGNPAKRILT